MAGDAQAIAELRATIRGTVLQPADADYDAARVVWNGMIDRRPRLIVRCQGVADVIAAVNFARRHGLLVAVRGGGHNVAGYATCDDGMMIDLSAMRRCRSILGPAPSGCRAAPRGAMSTGRPRPSGSPPRAA